MNGQDLVWYYKQGSYLMAASLAWYWKAALELVSVDGEILSDELLALLARVSLRLN